MQSRCVQLARMGCVVFHYDMIGYADSVQLPLELVHRFSRSRVKHKHAPAAGFYSAAAESRLHNVMGLHTYNSIRALDVLTSLPDVDAQRIAVTGGSGGGTQTFMLCAVDDRPLVSVPVVIVSTTRQGGCTCENICGLRIGTFNLEFTALHAPKPLLLISADDATRTMPQRGFPELKQHYQVLGAAQNAAHVALLHFPHNYNSVSRTAMYHWLNRHLDLGFEEPILEAPYQRLTRAQSTVWDERHPRPQGGPEFEKRLLDWLTTDAQRQMAALSPRDRASLDRYRDVVGGAWDILLRQRISDFAAPMLPARHDTTSIPPIQGEDSGGRSAEVSSKGSSANTTSKQLVRLEKTMTNNHDEYCESLGLLRYRSTGGHHVELPIVILAPQADAQRTVIWIDEAGKSGLYATDGSLKSLIRRLLDAGATVIGVDLLYQGEFLEDGRPVTRTRWLPNEEAFAGWTYCYNLPLFTARVHDILAVVALARDGGSKGQKVDLVGLGRAGRWVAAAVAQARGVVSNAAIDTQGFRFEQLKDVYNADFMPGGAKYDDLRGLLALAAPMNLWLAGEGKEAPAIVNAAYRSTGKAGNLTLYPGDTRTMTTVAKAAIDWLLER